MAPPSFQLRLQSIRDIAPGVKHFQFVRVDGQAFDFIPGQFVTLLLGHDGKKLRRSYSIASIPEQEPSIDFAASYVSGGVASELLFNLSIGSELEASGPSGRLVLRDEDQARRYLLIATGTGVTPYRSMLPTLLKRSETMGTEICILQGVRTQNDLLYGEDFIHYCAKNPEKMTFHPCYSRQDQGLLAHEHAGNVCHNLEAIHPNPKTDIVYLCGNPNMIDEAFEKLKQLGFDVSQVRREKYISP